MTVQNPNKVPGVTARANIVGELQKRYLDRGVPMARSPKEDIPLATVPMWTGKLMDGVDDDGNPIKVPVIVQVPMQSHIDSGQSIQKCIEKGFVFLEELPSEIKELYDQSSKRRTTPNTWEEEIKKLQPTKIVPDEAVPKTKVGRPKKEDVIAKNK